MSDDFAPTLAEYIATHILKDPGRRVLDDEPLISSGLVDSLSLVDLALFVEDSFGVRLDDTELASSVFDTVADLAALIRQRRASA
ncbi:MAG: acyl carrier protein [Chloroflexota bacterium]